MTVKRILILANSVKNGQHCIAGRELIERDGALSFGEWIRPVSRHGEGELSESDCRFPGGRSPKVFDVVDIPLEEQENSRSQPENWFIDPGQAWRQIVSEHKLPRLRIDGPSDLWREVGGRQDRISPEGLAGVSSGHSLYLIRAKQFRIQLGWRDGDGKPRKRRRGVFWYNARRYEFSITDPVMDRYYDPYPKPADEVREVKLDCGDDCVLCVSLTPVFEGYHYKVIAAVVERNP